MNAERKTVWANTLSYYLSFIAFGLAAAALGPTLPDLAQQTHTDVNEISLVFTARSLGFLVGAYLGGKVFDRLPGHSLLAGLLGLLAGVAVVIPLSPFLWLVILCILVWGLAQGMIEVGANTLLAWIHREHIGPYMNGLHFFFGVGAFLSPIIMARARVLTGHIDFGYWALTLFMLPTAFWLLTLPSPQLHGTSIHNRQSPKQTRLVLIFALLFLLYVGSEVGFGGWIYTYAVTLGLATPAHAAYLTSAFWGALTLGRLAGIPLSMRFSPRMLLFANFFGALVSIGLILIWPSSLVIVWLGTLGTGCSMASIFPTILTFAERRIQLTGKVTSWFFIGSGLGGMTIPLLIGQLFEVIGPRVTMIILWADVCVTLAIFIGVTVYYKQRGLTQDESLR